MVHSRRSQFAIDVRLRALGICALALSACASVPAPACTRSELIALKLAPRTQLNEDREGYPRSVVLRVYQLAQRGPFERARFDEHWSSTDRRGERVAALASEELTVIPGKRETRAIARKPEAAYLAVVGKFREHQGAGDWRASIALPPARNACINHARPVAKHVTVELQNYALQLR